MARKATGTIFRYLPAKPGEKWGHYVVRCPATDGTRPLFDLDPSPKSPQAMKRAQETAAAITEQLREDSCSEPPRASCIRRRRWSRSTPRPCL